jgi:hypothetical protein
MSKTAYQNLDEETSAQTAIMLFINWWVHVKKIPTPRKEIMIALTKQKIGRGTAEAALHALICKGYIRKAYTISNKTSYVALRTI